MQSTSASTISLFARRRGDALAAARESWFEGNFQGCLAALEHVHPVTATQRIETVLLRARALLRLGDAVTVVAILREAESWFAGVDAVTTLRMLLGSAIARVESEGAGLSILDDAAVYGREHDAHDSILAEIDYYRALVYWTRRDLEAAEALAISVARSSTDIITARAGQLASIIEAARGRHTDSYYAALAALRTLHQCGNRDDHLEANLLHQVAVYEAELRGMINVPQRRLASPVMDSPLADVAPIPRMFAALYNLYGALLDDDEDKAFAEGRFADNLAQSNGYRSRALADRAKVSRVYNEPRNAREFISHAAELAESFDWDGAADDEALSILAVAEELRWYDVPKAKGLVDRYESISGKRDFLLVRTHDERYRALEDLLIGAVRSMGPERDLDAIARLRRACSTFRSIGYLSRTAWTLIELDEAYQRFGVIGPNDYFLASAQQIIQQHFPRSFLARRIGTWEKVDNQPIGLNLTAAQKEVSQALCAGKTVDEIAEERRCSRVTVRNHIDAAMRRIGVHSRADLLRELARGGWFGPSEAEPSHRVARVAQATGK